MEENIEKNTKDNSSFYLKSGFALAAYVALTTATLGVACPVCVVASPALIATGAYQKFKKKKDCCDKKETS